MSEMSEEQYEHMLLAVLEHYGFPEPGWGERPFRCPVHDDAHASASVNRAKGLVHCHACGFGGNAANIVMERERVAYGAAMDFIRSLGVSTVPVEHRTRTRSSKRWVPPRLRSSA